MKTIRSLFHSHFTRQVLPLVACLAFTGQAWAGYIITDLGTLGGWSSYAYGINNHGQVVGRSTAAGNPTFAPDLGFVYSNGTMTGLETGDHLNTATGINNNGQVIVNSGVSAFLYSNGTMTNLGSLGGFASQAYSINNHGQVVGYSYETGNNNYHAVSYVNDTVTDLGTLNGFGLSIARGINDSGQIVGHSATAVLDSKFRPYVHAFLHENGVMTDLGTLGGTSSMATAINNNGEVVGSSNTATGAQHAFRYLNGVMADLGDFVPTAINNNGQVAGWARSNNGERAVVYSDGVITDLTSLLYPDSGWKLYYARGINDLGQIVGDGYINGEWRGFLMSPTDLTPVPVPAAVWFFASGLLGLAGAARKRKTA